MTTSALHSPICFPMRIDLRFISFLAVSPGRARLCLRLDLLTQALRSPAVQLRVIVPMLLRHTRQTRVTVTLA